MISSISIPPKKDTIINTVKHKIIYVTRLTIFVVLRFVYYILYTYGILTKPLPPSTITSLSDDYITTQKKRFLATYDNNNKTSFSENIEKCFYDTKLHALAVENVNNELEKKWKRRIMFENTPRGNIIMHYDAFKRGFVYYSDNSSIPYYVINAAVMKYVIMYRCRDFFIDDQITPENMHSPLLSINNTDKSSEKDNTTNDQSTEVSSAKNSTVLKSSAFAKFKSYNAVSGKLHNESIKNPKGEIIENDKSEEKPEKHYTRNKIIFSGKLSNFSMLQTPKIVKHVAFSSDLLDGLKSNSDAQNRVFNYRDFKKLKEKQTQ